MSSKKLEFFSYGNTIDATNYCSGIETIAKNFIEENEDDATIVYPSSNSWITARNDDEYRVTTENAQIILPTNIYKIKRVWILLNNYIKFGIFRKNAPTSAAWYKGNTTEGWYPTPLPDFNYIPANNCYDALTGEKWECAIDITEFVKTKEEFDTLSTVAYKNIYDSINKANTMYFSRGDNKLRFGDTVKKVIGTEQANIVSIIAKWINDFNEKAVAGTNSFFDRRLKAFYKNKELVEKETEGATEIQSSDVTYIATEVSELINDTSELVKNLGFRVEYIPLTSKTKIRARKSAKTTVDYFQAYNQRAEINAASALGKNMWLTAQKTGVKKITIVKRYTKIADIPRVGAKVIHNGKTYRICANHYSMTNTVYVQVTHTLSENWTMRSNHVALDQKYRNWNIPQDMLWRTLYIEEFAHVSFEKPTETKGFVSAITNTFNTDISNDKTVTHFVFKPTGKELNEEDYTQVVLPCMTYGVANSLVVSSTFKDNLSAGLRKRIIDGNEFCEDVLYCDKNGEVKNAEIVLTSGLTNNVSEDSIKNFPASSNTLNTPKDRLFGETFQVLKDAGEALKITYQQHFISDSSDIVIGKKLAENCPIVKKWQSNRTMLFLLLNAPLRLGEDVVPGENVLNELDYATCVVVNNDNISVLFDDARAVAWAITDERYNLLIGSNAETKKTIYFSITNKK